MMESSISAIIAVVLVPMLAWEWWNYALGRASLRWRRVEGTIVDLWFDVQDKEDADGDSHVSTSAHLVYDYVVNDRHFRCKHFTYRSTRRLGELEAYALLGGLRRGQRVEVRYDPKRPQRAVVLPGTDEGHGVRVCALALGLVVSLGYALAMGFPG